MEGPPSSATTAFIHVRPCPMVTTAFCRKQAEVGCQHRVGVPGMHVPLGVAW